MSEKIIIDCDPGQDDAVALFLALASKDELDIQGITTVAALPKNKFSEAIIASFAKSLETS